MASCCNARSHIESETSGVCFILNIQTSEASAPSITLFCLPHVQLLSSLHLNDPIIPCLSSPCLMLMLLPFHQTTISSPFVSTQLFLYQYPQALADQHRACASCLTWSLSSMLSVLGIGVSNLSCILLPISNHLIVPLVCTSLS